MSALPSIMQFITPDTLPAFLAAQPPPPPTFSTRTVTTDATLLAEDGVVFIDASGGDITFTLPVQTAPFLNRVYWLKRIDTPNNVTLTGGAQSSEISTLTRPASSTFGSPSGMAIVSDGTLWQLVARA